MAAGYTLSRTGDPRAACGRATVPGRTKKKKLGEALLVSQSRSKKLKLKISWQVGDSNPCLRIQSPAC